MPDGEGISAATALAASGSLLHGSRRSRAEHKMRSLCSDAYLAEVESQELLQGNADSVDMRATAHRTGTGASVAVPVGQDRCFRLHPHVLGDRMEMAHSVEGRVPFLDHHVVELICAMPLRPRFVE